MSSQDLNNTSNSAHFYGGYRQVKAFAQDHIAFKKQSQHANSGCLAAKLLPLPVVQEPLARHQLPDATSGLLLLVSGSFLG